MKKIIFILSLCLFSPLLLEATDNCANVPAPAVLPWNGLEKTPAMGWNSWYDQYTSPTQTHIEAVSDFLKLNMPLYTRIELSDGWPSGRVAGIITANATKFPAGMTALTAYIHANDQTAGIYTSPYPTTCGGFTGSGTYEYADAATFAGWGFDYLEADGCSISSLYTSCWSTESHQVWQLMANAVRASGRDMELMMGTNQPPVGTGYDMNTDLQWADSVGYNEVYAMSLNIFGGGGSGFSTILNTMLPLAQGWYKYEKPGYFPHCDYIVGQTENAAFGTFTEAQTQTQFGLYAMWGCPLLLGMDPSTLSTGMRAVLNNADVIAVDQDSLAHAGILYQQFACGATAPAVNCQIWVKPLHDGSWAVAFLNLDGTNAHTIAMSFANFGGTVNVKDLWTGITTSSVSSYSVSVSSVSTAGAIEMLKVTPTSTTAHTITNTQLENMAIH